MIGWVVPVFLVALLVGLYEFNRKKVRQAEAAFPPDGEFVTVEGLR